MPVSYTVRPFRPDDHDAYLSLYRDVFDGPARPAWFRWKYQDNPYADDVTIYVAETDGELVGARSFFPMPIAAGDDAVLAYQPCDTMVAADHRRRGLFTEMTEAAIEAHRDGPPSLYFNFPNDRTLPGNLDLGWRAVTTHPIYYRIQHPAAVVGSRIEGPIGTPVARTIASATDAYYRVRDALARPGGSPVTVERRRGVPIDILSRLYRSAVPDTLHTHREEQFLDWRFDNPRWDYDTFLAREGGAVVAAVVVGHRNRYGFDRANIVDALPLSGLRPAVVRALLAAVVDRYRDVDLCTALPGSIPTESLSAHGFLPDTTPPLSLATETTTLVVRPLSEEGQTVGGRSVDEAANWSITFTAKDTS
ncbi:GNAT family N-acetyltransferase [Halorientalis sp. IM1011]|uniref:GNAT family N-acetyltransferase n=1 Tax=Halorientalis sp. IM1011 TaxID=1932360 RepID=UPI0009FEBD19|nr:GNAT family N-acetyltransferase [Halorientalis sp. IM1011]